MPGHTRRVMSEQAVQRTKVVAVQSSRAHLDMPSDLDVNMRPFEFLLLVVSCSIIASCIIAALVCLVYVCTPVLERSDASSTKPTDTYTLWSQEDEAQSLDPDQGSSLQVAMGASAAHTTARLPEVGTDAKMSNDPALNQTPSHENSRLLTIPENELDPFMNTTEDSWQQLSRREGGCNSAPLLASIPLASIALVAASKHSRTLLKKAASSSCQEQNRRKVMPPMTSAQRRM